MLPERKVSLDEFLEGLSDLGIVPQLRFAKDRSWSQDNHNRIFLVLFKNSTHGSHIGRTCTCCVGKSSINDYDLYKDYLSKETYDAIVDLLFNFSYTDVEYKS